MPRKLRELRADLRRSGWIFVRQTGSHQSWEHPDVPDFFVRLSGTDGDDAKPYQEADIRRALKEVERAKLK